MATRATVDSPFENPVPVTEVNSSDNDSDIEVSGDNLELIFYSRRPGGEGFGDLWLADRDSTAGAFSAPRNLSYLWANSPYGDEYGPSLSADRQTLYFNMICANAAFCYTRRWCTWEP